MEEKFAKITVSVKLSEEDSKNFLRTNEIMFFLRDAAEKFGEVVYAKGDIVSEEEI